MHATNRSIEVVADGLRERPNRVVQYHQIAMLQQTDTKVRLPRHPVCLTPTLLLALPADSGPSGTHLVFAESDCERLKDWHQERDEAHSPILLQDRQSAACRLLHALVVVKYPLQNLASQAQ